MYICIYICIQTNVLTGKSHITAVHKGRLALMAPELIIVELSKATARIDHVWAVLMTFFTILNADQYYPF